MIASGLRTKQPATMEAGPRIGLALSGGGGRGSAHMGVLQALENAGIHYDMMAATSIGALAGLIHCFGYSADYMIDACKRELMPSWWLSRLPGGRYLHMSRMLSSSGISKKIRRYIGDDCRLEELATPLYITATDLVAGELVVQENGCAVSALMASMCLPGVAMPIAGDDRLLIDGGVLCNLPAEILRARGADIVIGVDISGRADGNAPWTIPKRPGLMGTLARSLELMNRKRYEEECAACDIVIRPDVQGIGFTAFTQVDRLAEAGYAATERVIGQLKQMIGARTESASELDYRGGRLAIPANNLSAGYDAETVVSI